MKVLFVCLGNICRSPMAEFVFKYVVKNENLDDQFVIESRATSSSMANIKHTIHNGTKEILEKNNIPYVDRCAKKMDVNDYKKYDLIIGMDDKNVNDIKNIVGEDKDEKVYKLLDFTSHPRDILDPWYYGNFDQTYDDIYRGCIDLLDYIKKAYLSGLR